MPPFDRENCLLCQNNSFETVHLISQFSKNEELLNAFKESPVALGIYKIHYERTLDATAGDLKYHTSCWRNIIFKREKRGQTSETNASTLNISTKDAPPQEIDKKDPNTPMFCIILSDNVSGVIESLANNNVLSIRDIVQVYDQRYEIRPAFFRTFFVFFCINLHVPV